MDDLQQAKKFLKKVAESRAKAERQRIKDRAEAKRQRAEDKRRQAIVDKERAELRKQIKETDRQIKETDKQVKKTSEQLKRTDVYVGHMNNRFGDLAEAMLVGDVSETLKTIDNLHLESSHLNVKRLKDDRVECEIDALLIGQDSIVVMEAKSKLTTDKIGRFIDVKLNRFTELFPDFANKNIYGAVGYLKAEEGAVESAIAEGLLVVRSTFQAKEILNPGDFQPKDYNPRH